MQIGQPASLPFAKADWATCKPANLQSLPFGKAAGTVGNLQACHWATCKPAICRGSRHCEHTASAAYLQHARKCGPMQLARPKYCSKPAGDLT